ncbi:MAG TPA: HNH endonuclease [Acidimicrobiales bacterium]
MHPNDTSLGDRRRDLVLAARFWVHVAHPFTSECWEWTGWREWDGYGLLRVDGRPQKAHRLAWRLTRGDIPTGLYVLHRCDNKPCVRPAHLYLGTQNDNMRDVWRRQGERRRGAMRRGDACTFRKLSESQVLEIRALAADVVGNGLTYRAIAERYGVNESSIGQIVRRRTWTHI